MKPASILTLVVATLVSLGGGTAYFLQAHEGWGDDRPPVQRPYPKATPPPAASPVYHPSKERVPSVEEVDRLVATYDERLARDIEVALASRDPQRREAALALLLPELIQVAPARAVDLVATQRPGEQRDQLRDEVARQWVARDRDAALEWMKSLESQADRRASFRAAAEALADYDPEGAARARAAGDDRDAVARRDD